MMPVCMQKRLRGSSKRGSQRPAAHSQPKRGDGAGNTNAWGVSPPCGREAAWSVVLVVCLRLARAGHLLVSVGLFFRTDR